MFPRRTCVITGGTGGIGLALATLLLQRNDCDVIIGANEARPERAVEVVEALRASLPAEDPPRLVALPLDLTNALSVEDFASTVASLCPRGVTWLFLNAARADVASSPLGSQPTLTADGHELSFATGYLGHARLTSLLLPAMARPGRVVVTSCVRHNHAWRLDPDNWQMLKPGGRFCAGDAYNNTKTMQTMFALKLNALYGASGVTANAVDPGIVPGTGLLRDASALHRWAFAHMAAPVWSIATLVSTPAQAAEALLGAAMRPESGLYLVGQEVGQASEQARDKHLQASLWDSTTKMAKLDWPAP